MITVDFDSLFAKIQIHSINNLHVYFIKFRTNDINRIGVNTTCKKHVPSAEKSNKLTCLIITFNSRLHDATSFERYVGQSTISFSVTSLT